MIIYNTEMKIQQNFTILHKMIVCNIETKMKISKTKIHVLAELKYNFDKNSYN